ncbi:MAG: cupin domain-containing protein [Nevskiales bacterium]
MSEPYFFEEGCYISEWLNDAHDPAVSVAQARVPPGVTTRWHVLDDITERYLMLEGEGEAELGDAPPQWVGPGDVVTIAPGQRQRIRNIGKTDLVFLAVCTPRFRIGQYRDVEGMPE